MLHSKFQGHWSTGSGEEDFFKVFTIYGHGGHVGLLVLEKKIFKVFTIYGHGGHVGHVTQTI